MQITKYLIDHPLATYLGEKASTEPEDISKFPKQPTLGKIINKLNKKQYNTINEWKEEMNLFWDICFNEYQKGSQCYAAVCVLSDKFQNKVSAMKFSPEERWLQKLKVNVKSLMQLIGTAMAQ